MKIKAYSGDNSKEFLLSDKYPLALGDDGKVYRFAENLKHSIHLAQTFFISDGPRLEFRAECDGKIQYVDINPEFWKLSNSFEQYMVLHNCGNFTLEEVFSRVTDDVKARHPYSITEVLEIRRNDYGEYIIKCKVRNTFYFKKHVFKKTLPSEIMVYLTKTEDGSVKIFYQSGIDKDKRTKTYTEKMGYYDENAPRSIYIDLPLLVDPSENK